MTLAFATFTAEKSKAPPVKVHFNPVSLKVSSTNTIADKAGQAHQASAVTASKLDLELIFDTSDTGEDVRGASNGLKAMGFVEKANQALAKVTFSWGAFSFVGSIESFTENIEFFSSEGVPLRLTAQLTMRGLKQVALPASRAAADPGADAGNVATAPAPANGLGATGAAQNAGDPRAGRALAAANGAPSMRFPGGGTLAVVTDAPLSGPAGLSVPAAGGLAEALAGASFGAANSAGLPASSGAFAGLGASAGASFSASLSLDTAALRSGALKGGGARFDLAGKRIASTSSANGATDFSFNGNT